MEREENPDFTASATLSVSVPSSRGHGYKEIRKLVFITITDAPTYADALSDVQNHKCDEQFKERFFNLHTEGNPVRGVEIEGRSVRES